MLSEYDAYPGIKPQYAKLGENVVFLRGSVIYKGTDEHKDKPVAVLPEGYRPSISVLYLLQPTSQTAGGGYARLRIVSAGAMYFDVTNNVTAFKEAASLVSSFAIDTPS